MATEFEPLVSVIMPVYNNEDVLGAAIESALAQTYRRIEVIVVNDGSTDNSEQVARKFGGIKCHAQPNQGISAARNRGFQEAHGSVLAFLDADDLWRPAKLERQVAALAADPVLDMVFGHILEFRGLPAPTDPSQRPSDLRPGHIPTTLLVRRDSFVRAGLYETAWRAGEFVSWYLRAQDAGLRELMLPDLVALRRLHAGNNGLRQRQDFIDYARILKASLDRRRAAAPSKDE